jgi:hypothetical protein
MRRAGKVHEDTGRVNTAAKKHYVKLPTVGVSSVVLKGSELRDYTLSVPDHRKEGAYWIHCNHLTRLDLETVVLAIQSTFNAEDK